jgi:hypothetical protein
VFVKKFLKILTDLCILNTPGHKERFLESSLSVWMEVCPASVRTVGWILFIFGIEEFICDRSLLDECEHYSSKNMGPSDRPQKQNWCFS